MDYEKIKQLGKCCITEEPLHTSEELTAIQLGYKATWKFPVWSNLITGQQSMAVAFVHDSALKSDGTIIGPIRFAVECTDEEIIYHPLETLQQEEIVRLPEPKLPKRSTAHPVLQMHDAAGTIHEVEYRQYEMSPQQQFAILGINRDLVPIEVENVDGIEYEFIGKLDEQGFIFSSRIRNSLLNDHWNFDTWSNPEILLITKK